MALRIYSMGWWKNNWFLYRIIQIVNLVNWLRNCIIIIIIIVVNTVIKYIRLG